jgi:hypothetical protein
MEDKKTMEDKNKMDQQSGRPNRDQETEKKPSQGSQDINRQGQGNVQQGQRDQQDREKKPA